MTVIVPTDWTSMMTAIGTVAVAVVAVAVAVFAEWRAGIRVTSERMHAAGVLADERAAANERLERQLAHSDEQLAAERAAADARLKAQQEHSDAQLREERQQAQQAEQEANAWAVEVLPKVWPGNDASTRRLVVDVINHGDYTITRVAAQFSPEGRSLVSHETVKRIGENRGSPMIGDNPAVGFARSGYEGILTREGGLWFRSDPIADDKLAGPYPVVRWHDRWGTCWEHKKGRVKRIDEGDPWKP